MNTKPLISVIIPARNEEKFIGKCLESIFSQDFDKSRFEVIVVDNGSVDKTSVIAKRYPVNLQREENEGCVFALIEGLKYARGEIIVFTDADCFYPKDWICKIGQTFRESLEIMALGGPARFYDGTLILNILAFLYQFVIHKMRGANFAIRKKFLLEIGGLNPEINFGWDTVLFRKIKRNGIYKIDCSNVVYTSARRYKRMFFYIIALQLINNLFLKVFSRGIIFRFPKIS